VLILYLHEKNLTPGTRLTVIAHDAQEGSEEGFRLLVESREVNINRHAADKIWMVR
jgi:DtxR family Mn-dependent transcriptional regulator